MQSPPHSITLLKLSLGRSASPRHASGILYPFPGRGQLKAVPTKDRGVCQFAPLCGRFDHFGGCGLPVLFFPGVPVAVGVRCAVVCGGVVRSLHPYTTAPPYFSRLPGKNLFGAVCRSRWRCRSRLGLGGWLLLTPSYNRFPVVFPDVLKKIFIHF